MKRVFAVILVWTIGSFIAGVFIYANFYEGFYKGWIVRGDFAGAIPTIAVALCLIFYWALTNYEKK